MIDCDIHTLINYEEILSYIEPGQLEWFRSRGPGLGLPDYPWSHPVDWFRADAEHGDGRPPSTSLEPVRREVLDGYSEDIGILTPADGLAISVMASPYRRWHAPTTTGSASGGWPRSRGFAARSSARRRIRSRRQRRSAAVERTSGLSR